MTAPAATLAERGLALVELWLARLTAIATLLVMLVIVADVAGRYLFASPMGWVYDIVSIYFINLVLYFMASETLRTGAHIALDLRLRVLPVWAWQGLRVLAWLAVAAALGWSAWTIGAAGIEAWHAGDVHPGLYEWPVWLEKAIVALGLAMLACRILLRIGLYLVQRRTAGLPGSGAAANGGPGGDLGL
ncbi:MAG: TRAP transporter small permease subunit [Sneathiellaceae bacterium]